MSKKSNYICTYRSKHHLKCHLILVSNYRRNILVRSVCSIGEASLDTIREYILSQG